MRIHLVVASLILISQSLEQITQQQVHQMSVSRKILASATTKEDKHALTGLGRIVQIAATLCQLTNSSMKAADCLSALVGIIRELHMLKYLVLIDFLSWFWVNSEMYFLTQERHQSPICLCLGGLFYCC